MLPYIYHFISSFTPYVLAAGSVLLIITLGIYTIFPKLLNTYTRIMRHFAMSLLLAFTCLWPQQLFGQPNHPITCRITGNIAIKRFLSDSKTYFLLRSAKNTTNIISKCFRFFGSVPFPRRVQLHDRNELRDVEST